MGPNSVTQPNLTHHFFNPTQPTPKIQKFLTQPNPPMAMSGSAIIQLCTRTCVTSIFDRYFFSLFSSITLFTFTQVILIPTTTPHEYSASYVLAMPGSYLSCLNNIFETHCATSCFAIKRKLFWLFLFPSSACRLLRLRNYMPYMRSTSSPR
jgi:hypothetical protein